MRKGFNSGLVPYSPTVASNSFRKSSSRVSNTGVNDWAFQYEVIPTKAMEENALTGMPANGVVVFRRGFSRVLNVTFYFYILCMILITTLFPKMEVSSTNLQKKFENRPSFSNNTPTTRKHLYKKN